MSVLSREIESYQRALDKYRRAAGKYDKRVDAHNDQARAFTDSLVRDGSGNPYVVWMGQRTAPDAQTAQDSTLKSSVGSGRVLGVFVAGEDGKLVKTELPSDMNPRDYELTQAEGSPGLMMLRKPTDEKRVETISGLIKGQSWTDESGQQPGGYYLPREGDFSGDSYDYDAGRIDFATNEFGSPWELTAVPVVSRNPLANPWNVPQPDGPHTYTASREVSVQPESPGEWHDEFAMPEPKAPDATLSAAKRMQRPSLSQIEGGLIGEAIRGRGVR